MKNKIVIWKNPQTEETEVYLTAAAMLALGDFSVFIVEEDAFGDLAGFEPCVYQWKALPAKVRKAAIAAE